MKTLFRPCSCPVIDCRKKYWLFLVIFLTVINYQIDWTLVIWPQFGSLDSTYDIMFKTNRPLCNGRSDGRKA